MYSPCETCFRRFGRSYTEECDSVCEYANSMSLLRPYGGVNEAVKVLSGASFPLVFLDDEHIDYTYRLVCAAKDGVI